MGFEIELHNSYFVPDELDDKWIPEVAGRKWVILTGDKRIATEPINKAAVIASCAQVIMVTDTNSLPEQWAASIIVGRMRLLQLLDKHPGPVFIRVGKHSNEHVKVYPVERKKDNEKPQDTAPDPSAAEVRGSGGGHSEGEAGAESPEVKAEGKEAGKE
jgi:hypothetical protein